MEAEPFPGIKATNELLGKMESKDTGIEGNCEGFKLKATQTLRLKEAPYRGNKPRLGPGDLGSSCSSNCATLGKSLFSLRWNQKTSGAPSALARKNMGIMARNGLMKIPPVGPPLSPQAPGTFLQRFLSGRAGAETGSPLPAGPGFPGLLRWR